MTPYYERDGITIYHGDCREILPALDPVDLLITDPPFVGLVGGYDRPRPAGGRNGSITVGDVWGASLDWVPVAAPLCRLGAMVFCTYHSLPETAAAFSSFRRVALVTWHKRNASPTGKNVPRFTEEYVWCFAARPGLRWDAFEATLIDTPRLGAGCMASPERVLDRAGRSAHPTQKPESVMRHLLRVGGSTILDPFMGTGTTIVAARDLGRKAIGIEREERYCEIAAKRLAQQVFTVEPAPTAHIQTEIE